MCFTERDEGFQHSCGLWLWLTQIDSEHPWPPCTEVNMGLCTTYSPPLFATSQTCVTVRSGPVHFLFWHVLCVPHSGTPRYHDLIPSWFHLSFICSSAAAFKLGCEILSPLSHLASWAMSCSRITFLFQASRIWVLPCVWIIVFGIWKFAHKTICVNYEPCGSCLFTYLWDYELLIFLYCTDLACLWDYELWTFLCRTDLTSLWDYELLTFLCRTDLASLWGWHILNFLVLFESGMLTLMRGSVSMLPCLYGSLPGVFSVRVITNSACPLPQCLCVQTCNESFTVSESNALVYKPVCWLIADDNLF